ncbi:MAG: hypothetical protein HY782_04480 [Chloroflexi bacterium]|nr:hypothetical protein [Chloroflexota bacterium]
MTRQEQCRRNDELFALFMRQVLENPALTRKISKGAQVIFLPENDPELYEANVELGKRAREKEGKRVAYIKISLVPQTMTVYVPRLEFTKTPA